MGFWNNLQSLLSISNVLLWTSVIMISLVAMLQFGKAIIDRKITKIRTEISVEENLEQQQKDEAFLGQIKSLEEELDEKTQFVDPFQQPIRTGSATVIVDIKSEEKINSTFMDRGGYIVFVRNQQPLLIMSSTTCKGNQLGNGIVKFRGVFNLAADDGSIGKSLSFLKDTEVIQIRFQPMEKDSKIISGKAICTFNGNARIELDINPQKMAGEYIFINDLKESFKVFD